MTLRMFRSFRQQAVKPLGPSPSATPPAIPPHDPMTTSRAGLVHVSTPRSIRSSTALLQKWTRLSAHVEMLILTRPEIYQVVVDRFADLLDRLDHLM